DVGDVQGGLAMHEQWTRSQPIRTAARVPLSVSLSYTSEPFPHQRLAPKVEELSRLGLSTAAIARALGVDWKTVRKSRRRAQERHDLNRR
ncbi:MAG: hypothetical protein AB1689_23570, partial [Thermodesulfobacteriota bacterium]